MKIFKKTLASLFITILLFSNTAFGEEFAKNEEFFNAVKNYIMNNYADEITEDELYDGAIQGMFEKLDKHSIYMNKKENKGFTEEVQGKMYGIGALIGLRDGKVKIIEPLDGSPAKKAGIMPGDIITAVDNKEFGEVKEVGPVVNMIKGDKGTEVTLTIERDGNKFDVTIIRDEIKINPVKHKVIKGDLGYLKISEFNSNVVEGVESAVKSLKKEGVKRLVLDLRGNPGGGLRDVVEVSKYFVPKGKVVSIKDKKGNTTEYKSKGEIAFEKVAVLIDNGSASASEILAGAIQDTKSGTLIGKKSYGKGTVQTVLNLKNGESIKLTIAKYYLPSDRTINGTGLTPDIEAPRYSNDINKDELITLTTDKKLSKNDAGLDVLALQQRLNILGYKITDNKGMFLDSTFDAVKSFQSDNKLYPYGTADITTLKKLNEKFTEFMLSDEMDNQLKKAIEILSK
ncbi:S41 family peptidase [Tepidibacter formicigenes]|jgi:carboxyl-terminal processing protease|uniref:Carboxyl-terminal processing protease n=1 Tax=Tepidibacter formicigenes DSM 15518 TaxID=1123349 RepID=A0A1M6STZ7_9FIRM|nr:S41 family peptidase [Tepidibacter formicigenes]SHK48136.1 carboxyl-terminal processing protease [Tepidibacter formicigenes DSM 15518]